MEEHDLITLPQASELTGIPYRTLAYGAAKGTLKTRKFGPVRMTTLEWVTAWQNNTQIHKPGPKKSPTKS